MVLWKLKKKNSVEIILKKHVKRVVELWRVTYRIICLKMELDGVMSNATRALYFRHRWGAYVKKRKHSGWT